MSAHAQIPNQNTLTYTLSFNCLLSVWLVGCLFVCCPQHPKAIARVKDKSIEAIASAMPVRGRSKSALAGTRDLADEAVGFRGGRFDEMEGSGPNSKSVAFADGYTNAVESTSKVAGVKVDEKVRLLASIEAAAWPQVASLFENVRSSKRHFDYNMAAARALSFVCFFLHDNTESLCSSWRILCFKRRGGPSDSFASLVLR
jgi:hypothetical protein